MSKRKIITCIFAATGMLILILDGRTAISGARDAIDLCIRTLIPSLFPYLVLSTLLTGALMGQTLTFLRPIAKLTGMPEGTESLLAVGLLGGYPAGAMNVALAWKQGQLSRTDAERLLAFCNNAGPSFLFGIIAPMFSNIRAAWLLWMIHIISAILVGIATMDSSSPSGFGQCKSVTLTQALEQAVKVMGIICGWVVLFRIIIGFLNRWFLWLLPVPAQVLISGILELSNGCIQLGSVDNEGLRFIIASILLNLGGICVTMQTASAASGLSLKLYLPAKLLQCGFSFLMSAMAQNLFSEHWHIPTGLLPLITALTAIVLLYLKRNKKISSIPAICGV